MQSCDASWPIYFMLGQSGRRTDEIVAIAAIAAVAADFNFIACIDHCIDCKIRGKIDDSILRKGKSCTSNKVPLTRGIALTLIDQYEARNGRLLLHSAERGGSKWHQE